MLAVPLFFFHGDRRVIGVAATVRLNFEAIKIRSLGIIDASVHNVALNPIIRHLGPFAAIVFHPCIWIVQLKKHIGSRVSAMTNVERRCSRTGQSRSPSLTRARASALSRRRSTRRWRRLTAHGRSPRQSSPRRRALRVRVPASPRLVSTKFLVSRLFSRGKGRRMYMIERSVVINSGQI